MISASLTRAYRSMENQLRIYRMSLIEISVVLKWRTRTGLVCVVIEVCVAIEFVLQTYSSRRRYHRELLNRDITF